MERSLDHLEGKVEVLAAPDTATRLRSAIRAHGHFAEYVPIIALMVGAYVLDHKAAPSLPAGSQAAATDAGSAKRSGKGHG